MQRKGVGGIISFEKTSSSPPCSCRSSLILVCLRWSWLPTMFVRETFSTALQFIGQGSERVSGFLRLPPPQMSAVARKTERSQAWPGHLFLGTMAPSSLSPPSFLSAREVVNVTAHSLNPPNSPPHQHKLPPLCITQPPTFPYIC